MAKCTALSGLLKQAGLGGGSLLELVQMLGKTVQWLVSGVLNGEPTAMAAAAVSLVLLVGVYYLTRMGAVIVALAGFFLLAVCTL